MLYSALNMKLRDEYDSLAELCASLDVDEQDIRERLKSVGFEYDAETNQFR